VALWAATVCVDSFGEANAADGAVGPVNADLRGLAAAAVTFMFSGCPRLAPAVLRYKVSDCGLADWTSPKGSAGGVLSHSSSSSTRARTGR
jgi:hypothetical protein